MPAEFVEKLPSDLAGVFFDLPVMTQPSLLQYEWDRIKGPGMMPVLERYYENPSRDRDWGDPTAAGIALQRIFEMDPARGRELMLKEIARPPLYVPETAFGSRALEILKEAKREMVLVVDEFGVVQGLLTLADILEEIVGAFEGGPQATQRQDGSWLLDGMLPNDEFKEIFNLRRLPDEEEYETLGGFVMLHLGRIPQSADLFEWNGMRFEVMDMDGKRVDKILVTTLPAKPPAPEK